MNWLTKTSICSSNFPCFGCCYINLQNEQWTPSIMRNCMTTLYIEDLGHIEGAFSLNNGMPQKIIASSS